MAKATLFPQLKPGRGPRPKAGKRVGQTARKVRLEVTLAEYLAAQSEDAKATILEQELDGAALKLGRAFDARQVWVYLPSGATRIDRVVWRPLTAVYADGIQRELRPEVKHQDAVEQMQLEGMGWRVVRLNWRELLQDPVRAVARVWFG